MNFIDNILNKITMYSLMLGFLAVLTAASVILAFLNIMPYNPWLMILNIGVLYGACKLFNPLAAKLYKAPTNWESSAITGLILGLIVGPATVIGDVWKLVLIAAIAVLSKFVFAYDRRHLFNPAAIAVLISALTIGFGASWWVGNQYLLPLVVVGGLLFFRKMRWFHLAISFLATYLILQSGWYLYNGIGIAELPVLLFNLLLYSPLLFFTAVMLTEPLTMPGGRKQRIIYGMLIGLLAVILPTFLNVSYGLELSLVVGNLLALLVYGNTRRFMELVGSSEIADNTAVYKFIPDKPLKFLPGQFMLWTLPHKSPDLRGHRRYFSIASAPTEKEIMVMTKFAKEKSSSFKQALRTLPTGETLMAASLDGDFILPTDAARPIVMIAGGVGIAPFRSMVKDLMDRGVRRQATLFYSNNHYEEICFRDLFEAARDQVGLKTVYTLTDQDHLPEGWTGYRGYINPEMIKAEARDYQSALFYVSGPDPMVRAMKQTLLGMGISRQQIKTDYFTGYA